MNLKPHHRPFIAQGIEAYDSSFFLYDIDGLSAHLKNMRSHTDPSITLWYACKANPLSSVLKTFLKHGYGLDVASQGELDHALRCGFKESHILSTGPSKSRKYLKGLIEHDIHVVILEGLNQVKWLNRWAFKLKKRPRALLRVQLDWQQGHSVLGGNEITPFGIDGKSWQALTPKDYEYIDLQGFHVFQWGNILDLKKLQKIWQTIATEISQLSQEMKIPLNILDLGGGLGIPYDRGQTPLPYEKINALLLELKQKFSLPHIWMELGRYAVGEFGYYATQVIDRKHVRGKDLLILDGGINHIARNALTGQPFPCEVFRQRRGTKMREFFVHGPLCTALDKLGVFQLPEDTEEGDWLIFSQVGAYGFTEAMPFFLCHNLPAEGIIEKGKFKTVRDIRTSSQWLV